MIVANAKPQEYDDYEQQTARPGQTRHHQQPHQPQQPQQQQIKGKLVERETTTWIPIIQYDKEQNIDGSYRTQ